MFEHEGLNQCILCCAFIYLSEQTAAAVIAIAVSHHVVRLIDTL